ncbi:MAG: DNA/RNA nuclease SfsA [Candidatus Wukongarchaeota archaeon]|nr:DNA/RNA nuclease SfsA [Candidatus Wukongarchaeota archaeon]MDO8130021.1 DNA/RNA nuclease SfsA [Candidatus Wukongarchaeota archaeon]
MKIEGNLVQGVFKKRLNRFLAVVNIDGSETSCFLPNPGRMHELLVPGTEMILKEINDVKRKTHYDILGVFYKGMIVSIDSRIPNKLIFEALKNDEIEEFSGYTRIKPEFAYGSSRFDFLLTNGKPCIIEAKSCTLVNNGVALFPDAVTERGSRHLLELIKAKKEGYRACVLFLVQRIDAKYFSPNDETDTKFGKTLREASKNGVEIYAYTSELKGNEIKIKKRIPVKIMIY